MMNNDQHTLTNLRNAHAAISADPAAIDKLVKASGRSRDEMVKALAALKTISEGSESDFAALASTSSAKRRSKGPSNRLTLEQGEADEIKAGLLPLLLFDLAIIAYDCWGYGNAMR